MYRFDLSQQLMSDWVMGNHFLCTYPGIFFQHMVMLSVNKPDGTKATYASSNPRAPLHESPVALRSFVRDTFGINVDDATHGISQADFDTIAERAELKFAPAGEAKL